MRRKNFKIEAQIVCLIAAFCDLGSCGKKKKKDDTPDVATNTQDGTGIKSPSSAGFTLIQPQVATVIKDLKSYDDRLKLCVDKEIGTTFILEDENKLKPEYSDYKLIVCKGDFASSDDDIDTSKYLDRKSYQDKKLQNIYVGIFTDKVDNIADLSIIMIEETEKSISSDCEATSLSIKTLKADGGGSYAYKKNLDQLTALQSGRGICTNATLVSYRDLTKVTLKDSYPDRLESVALTKVNP